MDTQFQVFCKENPYDFSKEQLIRLKNDIDHPTYGLSTDEKVDFNLWTQGKKSRQEYFADFISNILPCQKYQHLLEVGCGHNARLSRLLSEKGYILTAIDPALNCTKNPFHQITAIKDSFHFEKISVSAYDAVIAQEPCEATEHIVRACVRDQTNFIMSLCGVPHPLINGTELDSINQWYSYLENIDSQHCFLIYPDLIPGYYTTILMGIFNHS